MDERNYTIFVRVLSASKNNAGFTDVLPFNGKTTISVKERLASLYLFVNGENVTIKDEIKLTPSETSGGVILDATPTTVPAGTEITETFWNFDNGTKKEYDGPPKIERVRLGE